MLAWILLTLLPLSSFALEIYINSAEDNFQKYSTLHINNNEKFICKEIKNTYNEPIEVICAFSKKPRRQIKQLKNNFFIVTSFIKNDTYFISIKALYKMKLFADIFDLTQDDTVFNAKVSLAKRWTVLGYKESMPLLKTDDKSELALNFPFYLEKDKLPFVGSLDINGNPVYIKKVEDVKEYLKVKKYFQEKKYDQSLDLIDEILQKYPNTLFKAELLYYKIKVYYNLKDYENVIDYAKVFLREYSSDENIPEVLSLIASAYGVVGQSSDADYFFDRLFSEHPNSIFTQRGYIYKGEMLQDSGGDSQAEKFYKKALYETKSVSVAVNAAFHLAKLFLPTNSKKAAKYVAEILKNKPSYFAQHMKEAKDMMQTFADRERYATAAGIAKALLDAINPTYDEYEEFLKDWALWLSKTDKKQVAVQALDKYIKAFPDGDYINAIQVAKDSLFFELSDLNTTQKLQEYDKLISEYPKDTIGQRALYEKAKLLLQEGKYFDVLGMQEQLKGLDTSNFSDIDTIINKAALGAMERSLEEKNCKNVLDIAKDYKVKLSYKWDNGVYDCAMKGGDFQLSKSIAERNLKTKDIKHRKEWLYRYIKVDFATGNYSEMIDAANDLIALLDTNDNKYFEVYRYLFDAYERLGDKEHMIETMAKIEKVFGLSYKDIDRYAEMVALGVDLKDDSMIIKYGTKVMQIQKRSKSYPQSPYIEFSLYQAYMNKNDYTNALKVIASLDTLPLSKIDRARQKYLLGTVLAKLWRDDAAARAYKEAIAADKDSAWAKLAKSALEL